MELDFSKSGRAAVMFPMYDSMSTTCMHLSLDLTV